MTARALKSAFAALALAASLTGCDGMSLVGASSTLLENSGALGGDGERGFTIERTNVDPSSVSVEAGQSVTLSVETSLPATGYDWSATGGELSSTSSNPVTWTAPALAGTYRIDVKAMAGSQEARASFRLTVK